MKIEDCGADGLPCGEALSVIAEGEYGGGILKLNYVFDGADYSLTIGSNYVVHNRFGDTQMRLEFVKGKHTVGTLKSGDMRGNLYIFTHELKIILTSNGCSVRVTFSDGADGEKTVKNITAYAVKS